MKLILSADKTGEACIFNIRSNFYDREAEVGDNKYFVFLPVYYEHPIYAFKNKADLEKAVEEAVVCDDPLLKFSNMTVVKVDKEKRTIEEYEPLCEFVYKELRHMILR